MASDRMRNVERLRPLGSGDWLSLDARVWSTMKEIVKSARSQDEVGDLARQYARQESARMAADADARRDRPPC